MIDKEKYERQQKELAQHAAGEEADYYPDLSLEEMFVRDVERLGLTPEKVRSTMNARHSLVRKKLLADYGLTEETIDSASEETKSELASKLMYEVAHSPDAKLEHGFYQAAVARENRLLVKRKAEEILDAQRKHATNFSIPPRLEPAVQQRSTYLFHSELRDYFRSKYIEKIEKSDSLIPEFKDAALKAEESHTPNLYEVAGEMSAKLLHPDALRQILAEHHAAKQARSKHRREKMRKFFSFDSWLGALPLFVRTLIAPVEVKSVLSALGEEARLLSDGQTLGPALAIEIVTPRVVENVLSWCNEIRRDVRSGKTPRATALWLMMNVARDYLASGMFHIYRGRLSMQGAALKSINMYCLDELTKLGLMTAEERNSALKATNEDIGAVG